MGSFGDKNNNIDNTAPPISDACPLPILCASRSDENPSKGIARITMLCVTILSIVLDAISTLSFSCYQSPFSRVEMHVGTIHLARCRVRFYIYPKRHHETSCRRRVVWKKKWFCQCPSWLWQNYTSRDSSFINFVPNTHTTTFSVNGVCCRTIMEVLCFLLRHAWCRRRSRHALQQTLDIANHFVGRDARFDDRRSCQYGLHPTTEIRQI